MKGGRTWSRGGLTSLQPGVFSSLNNLTHLDLSHNTGLTSLPIGIFDNLTSLVTLDLGYNEDLNNLPAGVFDSLTSLTSLNLTRSTALTSLLPGVFDSLINLRTLHLSYSPALASLPSDVFDSLARLTHLAMGRSYYLTSLPPGVFQNLTSLRSLDLSSNYALTSLPEGVFDSLTNLTSLDLSNNAALSTLSEGTFRNLISLKTLDLSEARTLVALPPGLFDNLTSLTSLSLQGYRYWTSGGLTSLAPGVFNRLASLSSLDLSNNRDLTSLPVGIFDRLTSLTTLDLSHNYALASLPEGVFDSLTSLTTLDLSYDSRLTSIPSGAFSRLASLTKLDLRSCSFLSSLPTGSFDSLSSLTTLDLSDNSALASLPPNVFVGLVSLTTLKLRNNFNLETLSSGIFDGLSSLLHLDLSRSNDLLRLPPDVFSSLTSLTSLDLSFSRNLSSLPPGIFGNLSSLTTLDLSNSDALSSVPPGVFRGLTSLTTLDLSKNRALSNLSFGVFSGLASLSSLFLSGHEYWTRGGLMSLSSGIFDGLLSLTTLDLSNNRYLTSLPGGAFYDLTSLIRLDLSRTSQLARVQPGIFDRLSSLRQLGLSTMYALQSLPVGVFDSLTSLAHLDVSGSTFARYCPPPSSSAINCSMQDGPLQYNPRMCLCSGCPTAPPLANTTLNCDEPNSCSVGTGDDSFILQEGASVHCSGSDSCRNASMFCIHPSTPSPCNVSCTGEGSCVGIGLYGVWNCTAGDCPPAIDVVCAPSQFLESTPTPSPSNSPSPSTSPSSSPMMTSYSGASSSPSPSPTPQPSPPRSAWALALSSHNSSSHLRIAPPFSAQLACAEHCSSPQALILPCPRPGSCLPHSDVRLLTACQPGHRGLACQACADGWAATSPCTTCRQCPFNGLAPGVVKVGATAAQIALGLAVSLFAVHGYARAPDRVATTLFSGGLRLAMWYIGMAGQVALLAADTPGTLQATAHTLGHWADVCGMAQPWRAGQEQTLPPNGTMYARQPEPAQGVDVLGILGALTGRAGIATMPSAGCLTGGGDSRSPHDMANIIMAVYGAVLLCASASVLWCARPAPGKTWAIIMLLLAPAAYMQVVPSVIQGQARIVGLQPVWRGMSSPDDVAGHAADVGGYAASLTLQCLAATVGVLSVLAWRQWRRSEHLLPRGASIAAYCTMGYRMQYTPQQAVRLADATGADKALKASAIAAARASERACCGAGRLLPTHAFPALQMALVVLVAVMGSMTTSVVARLVCVGVGVAGSMALVQHRRPWALAELSDLDVLAHGGILVQVVCVGVGTVGGGLATAAPIISGVGHVLVLLWLAMAVARGYSGRARALLARMGRRLRALLPELGPASARSGSSGQLGDVADSQVPGVGSIVWALVQRCVRRGEVRPAASRPATDVLSVLGMVQEQGLTVETGMAGVVGDSGSTLVAVQSGSGVKQPASGSDLVGQAEASRNPLEGFSTGAPNHTVHGANPMLQTTGRGRQPLRVARPSLGSAPPNRARDLLAVQPQSGGPGSVRQNLPAELSGPGAAQRRPSVAQALLSQELSPGQSVGEQSEHGAPATAGQAGRRMSGVRNVDGRGRLSYAGAARRRSSVHEVPKP